MKIHDMQARWPDDTAKIIGAQRPEKRKDYGDPEPVQSPWLVRHGMEIATLLMIGVIVLAFFRALPGAVEDEVSHSRQVVAETKEGGR